MSVFIKQSDYANENRQHKRSQLVSPKTRLPKDMKTKKCSMCDFPAIVSGHIGKEKRDLCKTHYDQYVGKNETHPVVFIRATGLL